MGTAQTETIGRPPPIARIPLLLQKAELLKAHLWQIKPGQTAVTVTNYFDSELSSIDLSLDLQKTPQETMEAWFHQVQKRQKALPHIEARLKETTELLDHLSLQKILLEKIETEAYFINWQQALPSSLQIETRTTKAKRQEITSAPLERISSDGIRIAAGRNSIQNDHLTFRMARGNHWWFHAQGVAGSHVVAFSPLDPLPQKTLEEAAQLAVYYSKSRTSGKANVDYTRCKYIRKVKGAGPGKVWITQNKTIFVEWNEETLRRLLNSREA